MNSNFDQHDVFIQGELHKRNRLQRELLNEQQAMRKAYCKANNIPFEEIEVPSMQENLSKGSLYVLTCTIWLIIVSTIVCAFIGEGNFLTNFMKVWF
ncbi:hypothetical protein DK1_000048 [Bacillus phage DK1]|uniref:Uncharacterized protein n=1 Tax=Bacillus phage DK1 TaxID=2500808 RepID=A0A3T0IIU8_9CAUD|nr:hypothetical protein H3016_gp48 [Bacillus phage DK1]AZU99752.1 hypothetical protein DK1_000048 [Bacillus phage DK1]